MVLTSAGIVIIMVGLLLTGGLLSFISSSNPTRSTRLGFSFAGAAGIAGVGLGLSVLGSGSTVTVTLPWSIIGQALAFYIGPLSAFFILVISVVSVAVSLYSLGYVGQFREKYNLGVLGLLYNLFIFSMLGLFVSGNALMFLFFWEVMSLVSYFLVVYEHRDNKVRKAGFVYVVMTHFGTIFIMLAFFLLYKQAGDFSFASFARVGPSLSTTLKTVIFLAVTFGFGTKAGIVPLHIWLPKAHPAAPSNVSALMSGVMIKTAIFGFVKVVFEILGGGPAWWGGVIIAFGGVSALLGVMYALMENDIKRLLAYCSVDNIGIIFLGLGASMIFLANANLTMAAVGMTAALLHVFNHAIYKGLLFMGAGSIHFATHTRNMEKLGGLLKRMPWTGLFFLVGSLSISALPPFNGFVSEWLTFQVLIGLGAGSLGPMLGVLGPVTAALLALTGALAAACFVKAFGIQFLAQPRSVEAEKAVEVPVSMRLGMGILSVLCLILGVLPFGLIKLLDPVSSVLLGEGTKSFSSGYSFINISMGTEAASGFSPLLMLGLLLFGAAVLWMIKRRVGKQAPVRVTETWNCGEALTPKMEYTGTSFTKPIRIIFRIIFMPKRQIQSDFESNPYFAKSFKYTGSIKPVFEDALYRPTTDWIIKASNKLRLLQSGSIHLYLAYIFITLVILLVFAR